MSLKRSGLNPLAYMGVEPSQPAQFIAFHRDPTINDINFNIGTVWLNRKTESPWMLVNLDKGIATWIMFGSSSGDVVELMGNSGTASGPIVTVTTGAGNAQGTALFTGDNVHTLTETFSDSNNNTGLGASSLADLAGGSNNTALGVLSGTSVTSGGGNVFIGVNSGLALTTGTLNTLVGEGSGLHLTSGNSNIGLGVNAGSNYTTTESSNILLNNIGVLGESNTLRVGLSTGTGNKQLSNTYISGIQGVNVGSVASVVSISGDHLGTTTLTPGTGITITPVANTIVIAATGGGGGGSGGSIIGTWLAPSVVGSTSWTSPFGITTNQPQATVELVVPVAGTISNLYINVSSNASTSNDTVTLNVNGVNTALVATITAGTIAVFSDIIHSVSVAQGDEIQFELSASTTGIWQGIISADFTASGSPVDAATSFITSPATGTAIPVSGVITVAGTGGTTVTAGGGGLITINSPVGGTGHPLVTPFNTPGTFTWTKAAGTTMMQVLGCNGGAGGGSGARAVSNHNTGGGGGPGGPSFNVIAPASYFAATETVVVGSGGSGGVAVTINNTAGNDGTIGGTSSFGSIKCIAFTAAGSAVYVGQGGLNAVPGASTSIGISGGQSGQGSQGRNSSSASPIASGIAQNGGQAGALDTSSSIGLGASGGGAGGGSWTMFASIGSDGGIISSGGGQSAGFNGLNQLPTASNNTVLLGGVGGQEGSSSINGTNGNDAPTGITHGIYTFGTGGGGGGGQSLGSVAGTGGNGGFPGGGGGGGGSSLNGTASGSGGNGADGIVYVVEW